LTVNLLKIMHALFLINKKQRRATPKWCFHHWFRMKAWNRIILSKREINDNSNTPEMKAAALVVYLCLHWRGGPVHPCLTCVWDSWAWAQQVLSIHL
jgi:hypothetical protein